MTREYQSPSYEPLKPVLLCFSHLRWNFVYQRPQHLLSRAQQSHEVFFIEEPHIRDDTAEASLERSLTPNGVRVLTPQIPARDEARAVDIQRDLLDGFLLELPSPPGVLWYYTPAALEFSRHIRANVCVFDCMDELSAFRGASSRLCEQERELLSRADLLLVGGRTLFEAKQRLHPNAHLFPSSVDVAHFGRARRKHSGRSSAQLAAQLGFFGVIDERMDLDLVDRVAALRPDWQLNMIGPVVKIDQADLPRRSNIHWLGACSYDELPEKLGQWHLGIMPFALNEATRFISPTKTPEFLAAGLPVVSTPVRDVVDPYGVSGLVAIAATPEDLVARATELLIQPTEPWLSRVDAFLADTSWDKTWVSISHHLSRISERATRAVPAALGSGGQHV